MRRLVAEIGACNGDVAYALDAVEAFAAAGVTDIKGQLYTADTLTSRTAAPYGKNLAEPDTQYEMFVKTLTYGQWGEVKERCDDLGVRFFGSVFDILAVEEGLVQGWSAFKLASGDITYQALVQHTATACGMLGAELIFSTGAATVNEVLRARRWIGEVSEQVLADSTQLVCTLSYPTDLVDANVDRIGAWKEHVDTAVGYSDHTRSIVAADYAYRIGAALVEKHVTLTPGKGGDHDFAIGPAEAARLVADDVPHHDVSDALAAGNPNLDVLDAEAEARVGARRSIHTARQLEPGHVITETDLIVVRPGGGIEPWQTSELVGQTVLRGIQAGTMLDWWMVT